VRINNHDRCMANILNMFDFSFYRLTPNFVYRGACKRDANDSLVSKESQSFHRKLHLTYCRPFSGLSEPKVGMYPRKFTGDLYAIFGEQGSIDTELCFFGSDLRKITHYFLALRLLNRMS
jgi:hypothetical protein